MVITWKYGQKTKRKLTGFIKAGLQSCLAFLLWVIIDIAAVVFVADVGGGARMRVLRFLRFGNV